MRRPAWLRSLALVLGLWFPLVAGEPGLFDPCPTHGVVAAAQTAHMSHTAMAGHAHHGQSQTPGPSHQHNGCTCVGCCSTTGTALRAPAVATVAIATIIIPTAQQFADVSTRPRPAPEYARPYTTGPPRLA